METLDLVFTAIFIVGTGIVMILIYFYNKRHTKPKQSAVDKFQVKTKDGRKIIHESNKDYNWDLYESDVDQNYDDYIGYNNWKNADEAENRIKQLKYLYNADDTNITLSMFETMVLIYKYGNDIILDINGTYRVKKINLDAFISGLDYDKETIGIIKEIKEELDFSISDYKIDAKSIFYLMANAKKLGINKINNNSQVFLFAKKINNKLIENLQIDNDEDIIAEINIKTIESELNANIGNVDKEEESIYSAITNILKGIKKHEDAQGKMITEYPNGQKVIRNSMWDFEVIEEEENHESRALAKAETKDGIETASDEIDISNDLNNDDGKRTDNNVVKNNKNNTEQGSSQEMEKEADVTFFTSLDKSKLLNSDGDRVPYKGFLGEVLSTDELMKKINELSDDNIKTIIINILSAQSSYINFKEEEIFFILSSDDKYYVSYDYIIYCIVSLAANKIELLKKENLISVANSLVYPIYFFDEFVKLLQEKSINIFDLESVPMFYFENFNNINVSMKTISLTKKGEDLMRNYNAPDKISEFTIREIDKKEFKKIKTNKCSVNFSNLS